jgi:hypothetical protein
MNRYGKAVVIAIASAILVLAIASVFDWTTRLSFMKGTSINSTGRINAAVPMDQRVYGDKILDENGKEVMWRGAGGSYLFHSDDYLLAWEKHLPEIQKMGLNTVRLAFRFQDSNPGVDGYIAADTLDYARLDAVIDFLSRHNIKVILDLHNCGDMCGDFGSQKLIDDWVKLAAYYRGDSRLVAYELFNEPYSMTWDLSIETKSDVFRAYTNLTREIRKVDPDHIHIWEIESYYLPPLEDIVDYLEPNIVFAVHKWWTNRSQEFEIWNPEQLSRLTVGYLAESRTKFNIPFWLGEFGACYPFNSSNLEWQLTQQLLLRCEEQAIGWNLWMGRTSADRSWDQYVGFFPLDTYNANLTRQFWQCPSLKLTDYTVEQRGAESLEFYRTEMWHNDDYITIKAGITVLVITNHALPNGSLETTSKEKIEVINQLTIRNEEGTTTHPGDWNIMIYVVPSK